MENIPRVLPEGVRAIVRPGTWPIPPVFSLIQQQGGIATDEMYRVFNMGIGMVVIVSSADTLKMRSALNEESWVIGELTEGTRGLELA